MTNIFNFDIIQFCKDIAKEFPCTAKDVYHIVLDYCRENPVVVKDELVEYCHKRLREYIMKGWT